MGICGGSWNLVSKVICPSIGAIEIITVVALLIIPITKPHDPLSIPQKYQDQPKSLKSGSPHPQTCELQDHPARSRLDFFLLVGYHTKG